jgi:hypothetical protein
MVDQCLQEIKKIQILAGIFEDLPNSSMEIDGWKIIEMIIARKCI